VIGAAELMRANIRNQVGKPAPSASDCREEIFSGPMPPPNNSICVETPPARGCTDRAHVFFMIWSQMKGVVVAMGKKL